MKLCTLFTALLLILQAGTSTAATVHHWRFESSPGFLEDSVGSLTLSFAGTPLQAALPGLGRGSSFRFVGNDLALDVESADRLFAPSFAVNDFTVEVFAHADALPGSFGNTLAATADSQANAAIGWLLQIRSGQLTLFLCNGSNCDILFSGLSAVSVGKDYFLAAAVDLDGGQTTFYLQNLTDGGLLESNTVSHSNTSLNTPVNFAIGGAANGQIFFDGLIDEVRISDHLRSPEELLINEATPLPALGAIGMALLAAALVAVTGYSRRAQLRRG